MDEVLSGVIFWALVTRTGGQEILPSPRRRQMCLENSRGNLHPHGPIGFPTNERPGPRRVPGPSRSFPRQGSVWDEPFGWRAGGEVAAGGRGWGSRPPENGCIRTGPPWARVGLADVHVLRAAPPIPESCAHAYVCVTSHPTALFTPVKTCPSGLLLCPGPSGLSSEHGGAASWEGDLGRSVCPGVPGEKLPNPGLLTFPLPDRLGPPLLL